ncbi:MAG TPA: alkaline phosphatase family protein [Terriglobales bacterium]|nr:alkaline phosphatase family protein [Terriglobales bacterium]
MKTAFRRMLAVILLVTLVAPSTLIPSARASAYNGRPKLVVVIVIDQLRGDYLERYRDQFVPGGFRLFLDKGAYFPECYYEYANTKTAPGHATLFTGAYTSGHNIIGNEWWDPARKKQVTSVEDAAFPLVGAKATESGASPRNLVASTIGDELKLATQGKSRVYSVSFKDRSSVLPGGHAADGAFWIEKDSGLWISSEFYGKQLPAWAGSFNAQKRNEKYWNLDWKDAKGNVMRSTAPGQKDIDGSALGFYDIVGRTPFSNDYQLEFVKELIANEKLGTGPATDLLAISFSSPDILGHKVGPDSPQQAAMILALDKQLAEFFGYIGRQFGLANVWIALSADHGIVPMSETSVALRIPSVRQDNADLRTQLNNSLAAKLGARPNGFFRGTYWPIMTLNEEAFGTMKQEDAERLVGETVVSLHPEYAGYYTKSQLKAGETSKDIWGQKFLNSYSPNGGWWVILRPPPFNNVYSNPKYKSDTDHTMPYSYDAHVPLLFYGFPFAPGTYRNHAEPVDLAVTLTSLLGVNKPSHATGRVLVEALAPVKAGPRGDDNDKGDKGPK